MGRLVSNRRRILSVVLAVVLAGGLIAWWQLGSGDGRESLTFDEFTSLIDSGDVATAEIKDRDNRVVGELSDGTKYESDYVAEFSDELTTRLTEADPPIAIEVDQQRDSFWVNMLLSLLPVLILVGVFLFFLNALQGGGSRMMQFGRAKARRVSKDQPTVTFDDVAGAEEAVEELREIKDFLSDPDRFSAMGAKIPKGVLLFGPPGTGKTLLARAVAGEAGVPFFSISGSDFVEMFVGVGASRVRDLFKQAKDEAPAIVFMDEIDAVGRHRGAGLGGGHDEREQTLNQLLVEMDGFDVAGGVILIAATNRPDILDPALLRPGRFDRQIVVDRPDLVGRKAILAVHAAGKPIASEVDLDTVARRTPGFTGADLANLLNEAALIATRRNRDLIANADIDHAVDRVIAGPERKSRLMSDRDKQTIAYHEAGHALVGHVLPNTDPIHKVSIIARGRALGWTLALPEEDRYLKNRSELEDELAMLLGGRTAEEIIFGDPSTGAANDIERVTDIARSMVTEWGMSETLGPQKLGNQHEEVFLGKEVGHQANYSDEVAARIDDEVRRLVDAAHTEAREILTLHRVTLDRLADALVENETLDEAELQQIFGDLEPWDADAVARPSGPVPGRAEAGAGGYRSTRTDDDDPPGSPPFPDRAD